MRCCDKLLSYVLEAIYCIFLNFDTQLIHNYECIIHNSGLLLYKKDAMWYSWLLESRRGEIGIHDRLKIYWGQLRKGSSPFAGMFFTSPASSIC